MLCSISFSYVGHPFLIDLPLVYCLPSCRLFISVSTVQSYSSLAYVIADLHQLAAADLFVGTFSSNVGRLVFLFRDALGKPRDSSVSVDNPGWWAGRQLRA